MREIADRLSLLSWWNINSSAEAKKNADRCPPLDPPTSDVIDSTFSNRISEMDCPQFNFCASGPSTDEKLGNNLRPALKVKADAIRNSDTKIFTTLVYMTRDRGGSRERERTLLNSSLISGTKNHSGPSLSGHWHVLYHNVMKPSVRTRLTWQIRQRPTKEGAKHLSVRLKAGPIFRNMSD